MNEGAVKVAVHRLRQRYRALLRETIAETVASEAEVEEELRYLLRVVSGGDDCVTSGRGFLCKG